VGVSTRVTKLMAPMLRIAVAVSILVAGITVFQDRLMYFPARSAFGDMVSAGLRGWPSPQSFRGLMAEPRTQARATAIVFHGNAGHAGHRQFYARALVPLGVRVLLAEYPGYGPRNGSLGENSLVADAAQTIKLAHREFGAPLLLIGESLGAGVAAAANAREPRKAGGMLLITPWDRLEQIAAYHYPWLPVQWLLRDRYDSVTHLASFRGPVLVAVAEQDRIVPARFGKALFDTLAKPKRLTVIKAAGHNDWPGLIDERWWREALSFLLGEAL